MAEFLRFSKVKKTRKPHRCFACEQSISVGEAAYNWVSVDGGKISDCKLHDKCGEIVSSICFSCRECGDMDGYQQGFLRECMISSSKCEGVKAYREGLE